MSKKPSVKAILEAEYEKPISRHDLLVLWGRKQASSSPVLNQIHKKVHRLIETRRLQITRGRLKLEHGPERWKYVQGQKSTARQNPLLRLLEP